MCFFDSPIGRCEAVRELVLLDETQHECACEHGCAAGFDCPLKGWFTEQSGVSDAASLPWGARLRPAAAGSTRVEAPRVEAPRLEAFVFS
ncbi:MAG: hypothetical protein ROZ37_08595 [Aromatoleum sp.]|uniref:hypothetical protein n=1 Tax=Aromatoleum sp. TaxID=2307007 RepID=UPI002895FE21|nr:hypothetical protein [Aromatoleum sp.]MDT3670379.1 hypothetical protein [Aromatoleum sp.]